MADLLKIGTSGVLAQQQLLQTTSNNISNVNTAGYSRQENIIYTNVINQGCGYVQTRRVLDNYAERELLRDNASVSYYSALTEGLSNVDKILSDSSTGLSPVVTELFGNIQSANNNPTSVANRNELQSSVELTVQRINTISSNIQTEYRTANNKIVEAVDKVNQLLDGIYKMNGQLISSASRGADSSSYLQMQDERDRMITELSTYLDIKTVAQPNGSLYVNMASGQTLVLGDGCAKLFAEPSQLDESSYELKFTYGNSKTTLKQDVGGSIGGYFDACEGLKNAQREVGKMTVALADALNCQNRSGLTLTNKVGGNLFTLKDIVVNSDSRTSTMTMQFAQGEASKLTGNDYMVVAKDDAATEFEVFEMVGDNKVSKGIYTATGGKLTLGEDFGFNLTLNDVPTAGDVFLVQPTLTVGFTIESAVTCPEDFAFASVIRCNQNAQNMGNASLNLVGVTSTAKGSAFNVDADHGTVALNPDAPSLVRINKNGDYEVFAVNNGVETKLGTADASTRGQNLLANLKADDGSLLYADVAKNPGFELNLSGTVKTGDEFNIELNLNGSADNSNGILLQNIEQKQIVNGNVSKTFSEAYSSVVSYIGTEIKVADINHTAAKAKQSQSEALSQSSKGVELNEEASNLVRFQQSYQASARIITAAQSVFDSLMSALG